MRQLDDSRCCEVGDLVDGLLFATSSHSSVFCAALRKSSHVRTKFELLRSAMSEIGGREISVGLDEAIDGLSTLTGAAPKDSVPNAPLKHPVLPFSNAAFDKHLAPVHLEVDEASGSRQQQGQSMMFKELSHWHNHQKALSRKLSPQHEGWFARRRRDWFMAEMRDYPASLTNATGVVVDPEIIIVEHAPKKRLAVEAREITRTHHKQGGKEKAPNSDAKAAKAKPRTGKAAALEAAAAIMAAKAQSKTGVMINFWQVKLKELAKEADLESRYINTKTFLNGLSDADGKVLRAEVELYAINALLKMWIRSCEIDIGSPAMEIAALIWDAFLRLKKVTGGMTTSVVSNLKSIAKTLHLPAIDFQADSADRTLSFAITKHQGYKSKSAPNKELNLQIKLGHHVFQLEHCGPYFDRNIDSSADSRVPFAPDAWQCKVLDAIDDGKSLFVVAPTSASKTFISFYSMKKILLASNEDVVVYVAPTKALVNQIAAEIQARFSKSFQQPGRSVWGIHTRDYRINNPTGCQILVTVPHILQIMLLAPAHAEKQSSWSYRIKRIIFDEVHCIGQADDGLIWEQLLLQAPCPIIALSATIGNPQEFSDWLSSTQKANGHELVTVQHPHRYSDLRKFIYRPPKRFCFAGLPAGVKLQIPGLDGSKAFDFVHPVASLAHKYRGMPEDLTLEARDCLQLWKAMARHQSTSHPLPSALDPERSLPQVIHKSDTIQWEADLKDVLRQWMADSKSPFNQVRKELGGDIDHEIHRGLVATKHECDSECNARDVSHDQLASLILPLLVDLHQKNALPAIVFNYDRAQCEAIAKAVMLEVESKEEQ